MKYILLLYGEEGRFERMSPEELGAVYAAHGAYGQALREANADRGAEQLQPAATATCVRIEDGERIVTDGPFSETKEQLGGFYLIEANGLDEAIAWAASNPQASHGTVEIRPIVEM